MRIRTALSTLALTAASLAVGAGGALADDAPDLTVNNSSNTTFPGVCASNQFSFVTVPVNLAGGSDSGAC
ncbi:hypothetical protein ACFV27_30800 [Streptomyces antimycoticus]|uniref:Chaplin domain-containing protein n=3 Tax=Streptomyces TaxID=1883 RepID=A0ABD5J838_9ACTN|nr:MULTISPECIES: hypothetical protein [Streptomyces]MEE4584543.1 hypothetical protein [Streptomyces sp. DSM 41602]AJZ84841.1 hypothetical protein AS97_25315 [Streptomyces sp. AgN23]KUL43246.1 hypothetical protein ADL28_43440 [Streptomyces violaceusniger]RSS44034.1 hypothetical protein EF902_17070 [Streptomyces sp. WAC05858]WTA79843.1 hypothetical protein OG751_07515 [Streptomyces antimycoticus]